MVEQAGTLMVGLANSGFEIALSALKANVSGQLGYLCGNITYDLKQKCRPLVIVAVNASKRSRLSFNKMQFDSGGSRGNGPNSIGPGESTFWAVANKDGGFMTGVSGELYLRFDDGRWANIGFSSPYSGSFKGHTRVVRDLTHYDWKAYNKMDDNNP
jgi:hypothetical protein